MAHNGARTAFIAARAGGATVTDAAAKAGVSRRTAARWDGEPEVVAELSPLSTATLDHLRLRLLGLGDAAADLLDLATRDPSVTAAQVSAARTIVAQAMRLHDATVGEQRIAELERYVEAQQGAWPPHRWSS